MLANQQRLTYISSMQTLNVVERTWQEKWMMRMDGEKESKKSVLSACLDDGFIIMGFNVIHFKK